jgi:D-alanine-D-alanine ligase
VAYNGLGYSVGDGAFRPGRKSLIPLIADSYGFTCANSDAYACAFTLHKFHCFTLLHAFGVRTPQTWQYGPASGWISGSPPSGTKVIAKSAYESWAVGVTRASVFVVDDSCTTRVAAIADEIGQAVTVQEFISGPEVYVPVLSCPELVTTPPVESILTRAPHDHDAFVTLDDNLDEDALFYRRFDGGDVVDERLRSSARQIFELLQLEGFGRIDFRVDAEGQPWVIDVAISPGMEAGGAGSKSLAEYGVDHASFIRLVVAASLATRGLLAV